ncbi:MAG: pyridoxamine 5'-phosphate oxidase family protein [Ornithinimicrobium sp.]
MNGTENPDGIEILAPSDCWRLLRAATVGRVAVVRDGVPEIFPVNHVVDHGTVVYRTGPGALFEATLHQDVAFEVDGFDDAVAWSVVLHGRATESSRITDLIDSFALPLAPWQSGPKPRFVRIEPSGVSGRRFPRVQHDALTQASS